MVLLMEASHHTTSLRDILSCAGTLLAVHWVHSVAATTSLRAMLGQPSLFTGYTVSQQSKCTGKKSSFQWHKVTSEFGVFMEHVVCVRGLLKIDRNVGKYIRTYEGT